MVITLYRCLLIVSLYLPLHVFSIEKFEMNTSSCLVRQKKKNVSAVAIGFTLQLDVCYACF